MHHMSPRGWATFAWQADYGQFYLADDESHFAAPEEITPHMMEASFCVTPKGLVIYTADSLLQNIRIRIYDDEPVHSPNEEITGKHWTRVRQTEVQFPSKKFLLSSPSAPSPLPAGPVFMLTTTEMNARIHWMEFQGSLDDSVPAETDVIEVTLWPRVVERPVAG